MAMEYDNPPSAGGFFSNKRNVLIVAGLVGAGAGLVFLLSRKAGGNPDPSQTSEGANAQDIAWGNLANQLLGFRGDVSVAMAKQSDEYQDLLDQFMLESQSRQSSDGQLLHLTNWLNFAREYETRQNLFMQAIYDTDDPALSSELWGQYNRFTQYTNAQKELQGFAGAGSYKALYGGDLPSATILGQFRDSFIGGQTDISGAPIHNGAGAGGASIREVLYTIVDNSQGNYQDGYAAVAAGPVRYMHRAKVQ